MQAATIHVDHHPSSGIPSCRATDQVGFRKETNQNTTEKLQRPFSPDFQPLGRLQRGDRNAGQLLKACSHRNGPRLE